MRHYWVDRVVELLPGERAVGVKGVALSEPTFDSHFPGNPVLPGIHLLEGLAQTAGILLDRTTNGRRIALLASVDRVRFSAFARPGDLVRLEVEIISLEVDTAARVRGRARAGEKELATANILFRLIEPDRLIPAEFRPFWERVMSVWRGEYLEP